MDKEELWALIAGYMEKHPLAKELGGKHFRKLLLEVRQQAPEGKQKSKGQT